MAAIATAISMSSVGSLSRIADLHPPAGARRVAARSRPSIAVVSMGQTVAQESIEMSLYQGENAHNQCENAHKVAQALVRGLRVPQAGETIARQIYEAAKVLGLHRTREGLDRVRRAWHGRAGAPTLFKLQQLVARLNEQSNRRALMEVERLEALFRESGDEEFYRGHLESIRAALVVREPMVLRDGRED